jgi:hypothetical protein
MKTIIAAIFTATSLLLSATSIAHETIHTVTRSEVRAEVVAAEQQGTLHQPNTLYARQQDPHAAGESNYGRSIEGSWQAASRSAHHSLYSGH